MKNGQVSSFAIFFATKTNKLFVLHDECVYLSSQRKILVLVNGNKFKIDRQQHNSTSNFVSANALIAKFIRYDTSFIASLCVNVSD